MNTLTICPKCGDRGLLREFKNGVTIYLHGKNQNWERMCFIEQDHDCNREKTG